MLETGLELLKTLEKSGFSSYIVGGFVRDKILNRTSYDIDISTSATPKEILKIFKDSVLPKEEYGSITLFMDNNRYEITTFRREIEYINNRKPTEIEYIKDLKEDLLRRDFTINSLCIDSNGEIIDLLGAMKDLNEGIIKTIGNPDYKFSQDSLRMLRAVRFATILNFKLSDEVKEAIIRNKELLRNLSYSRKRQELDKIFTSKNATYGVKLLMELGLDKELGLGNIDNIKLCNDIIGIWASLKVDSKYLLNNNEKEIIDHVNEVLSTGINNHSLYKYGLYVNQLASLIIGMDYAEVVKMYANMPIREKKDIDIKPLEICKLLNKKPDYYLKEIYRDIINSILDGKITNEKEVIANYIVNNY